MFITEMSRLKIELVLGNIKNAGLLLLSLFSWIYVVTKYIPPIAHLALSSRNWGLDSDSKSSFLRSLILSSGTGNKLTDSSGLSVQKMGLKKLSMQIFIQEKKNHQFNERNPFSLDNYITQKNICILVNRPSTAMLKKPHLAEWTNYNPFKTKIRPPKFAATSRKIILY